LLHIASFDDGGHRTRLLELPHQGQADQPGETEIPAAPVAIAATASLTSTLACGTYQGKAYSRRKIDTNIIDKKISANGTAESG
jgi:hypothetical protein